MATLVYGNGTSGSFALHFHGLAIFALSFDRETFPDATCAQGSGCACDSRPSLRGPGLDFHADGALFGSAVATAAAGGRDPEAIGFPGVLSSGCA